MSDRMHMDADESKAVAQIATGMADIPTTADVLMALHRAYRAGFARGFVDGQKNLVQVQELILGAMA